ncbi:MAG: nucleotidyltransferase family protein [Vicinamibacteria bacterium]
MTTAPASTSNPNLPDAVRRLVQRLGAEPTVRRIVLFGSRARGEARPRSDVDIAVEAPAATARDWLRLVDIAEDADTLLAIDLVRLDDVPPELRDRILTEGQSLFER